MNPSRICCWVASFMGPGTMMSNSNESSAANGRPLLTGPERGIPMHPVRVIATRMRAATARTALLRISSSLSVGVPRRQHRKPPRAGCLRVARHERQGRAGRRGRGRAREGQPEHGSYTELGPQVWPAPVCERILLRNRKTETGSPDCPSATRISTPEPVKHTTHLLLGHTQSVVPHRQCDAFLVTVNRDNNGMALTVLNRIPQQVEHDPADSTRINIGVEPSARCPQQNLAADASGETCDRLNGVCCDPHNIG